MTELRKELERLLQKKMARMEKLAAMENGGECKSQTVLDEVIRTRLDTAAECVNIIRAIVASEGRTPKSAPDLDWALMEIRDFMESYGDSFTQALACAIERCSY